MNNKLLSIQTELKAPKSQFNSFGKYHYRNCEDILEALKPLLKKYEATFFMSDEVVAIGNRIYIKATAKFIDGDIITTANGYAREDESKKGMDACQVSGAASSYARKYALNALFLIDDTKDSDSTNTHGQEDRRQEPAMPPANPPAHKHNPHEAAPLSPDAGALVATGKIASKSVPNAGGFISWAIEGYQREDGKDMKFSSKDPVIEQIMDSAKGAVSIKYRPNSNPNYAANILTARAVAETEEVPF